MKPSNTARVNVSVANLYAGASYQSEIVSQAVLNEPVILGEHVDEFFRIRQQDGYEAWIDDAQVVATPAVPESGPGTCLQVRVHSLDLRQLPDPNSFRVRDAVIGSRLDCVGQEKNWYQILLPDGLICWGVKSGFGTFPELGRPAVVDLAREFLGYPYCWGGNTPKGMDCSGFVRLVFGLLGRPVPRDSWMQHQQTRQLGQDPAQARPGDLYFFARTPERVTHVGIALGDCRVIHARGRVRINSLDPGDPDYDAHLRTTFVSVNRIIQGN